jgi:trigger factor
LRSSLVSRFQTEAEQQTKTNKQQALSDELLKHLEVELPETLIEQEVDALLSQTAMQLSRQGIDIKKLFTKEIIPQMRQRSRPEAIDRLKRSLALQEVAKRESIKVEPAEIEARVQELMQQYSGQDIDRQRLREVVEEEIVTEKIMNWLEEHSTIELVPKGSLQVSDSEQLEAEEIASAEEAAAPTDETTPENPAQTETSEIQ